MSLPREVVPGRFYLLTRRCTQRQFLLRPDDVTNETFDYCLAEAAERFGIDIILPSAMSNHHHTVIFDRHGTYVEFMTHFHKMLAKAMNVHRGRSENFWATDAPSVVRLIDRDDVIDKIVYAATNPVKDGLVDRVDHWPGVNGLSALLNQRTITVRRPRQFFRTDGKMPETVELRLAIPPELGDRDVILRVIRERVAAAQERFACERQRSGRRVVGRRGILRQEWRACPATVAPRGELSPTLAAKSVWRRIEALQRDRAFLEAYRAARAAWLRGEPAVFPYGTYWLRRFANVQVAPASKN